MSESDIPKILTDFVFHSIDSAEQLDILLVLHSKPEKNFSSKELSDHLRSSPNSIDKRLKSLIDQNLTLQDSSSPEEARYRFNFENETAVELVSQLAEFYKSHRYRILEIIFSPLKKSRNFADAFKILNPKDPKGGRNAWVCLYALRCYELYVRMDVIQRLYL